MDHPMIIRRKLYLRSEHAKRRAVEVALRLQIYEGRQSLLQLAITPV